MKASFFLTYTLALLVLVSCKKDALEKTIDTDILVSAELENNNVVIVAETEKIYPCMNYQISHSLQRTGHTYIVKFTSVEEPSICLTAGGPAKARIAIGNLPPASYPLVFRLNGKENSAILVVDSAATLQMNQSRNVRLK